MIRDHKNFSFIYSDIDGTLFDNNLSEDDYIKLNSDKLNHLITTCKFGVATTRGFLRAKDFIGNLTNLPLIVLNGSEIYDNAGKCIYTNPIDPNYIADIVSSISHNLSSIQLIAFYPTADKTSFIFVKNEKFKRDLLDKHRLSINEITTSINQFYTWLTTYKTSMVEVKFNEGCERNDFIIHQPKLHISWDGIFYITNANVSKFNAIKIICEKLNLNMRDGLIVGNSISDFKDCDNDLINTLSVGQIKLKTNYKLNNPNELIDFIYHLQG